MGVGIFAALRMPEPAHAAAAGEGSARLRTLGGFVDAVVGPFVAFFKAHGALALLMLLMISVYRLPEFLIGPVAGPFYSVIGVIKEDVIRRFLTSIPEKFEAASQDAQLNGVFLDIDSGTGKARRIERIHRI